MRFSSYNSLEIKLGVSSDPYLLRSSNASERVSVGIASSMIESNSFSEIEQFFLFLQGSSLKSSLDTKFIVPHVSPYSESPLY